MLDAELQLLAGTSWLFSREELDGHVDTLFVDEAGQVSLADALAVGTAARNLVLLGDPNQLAQVSQGSHPPGADASVLQHLLGDDETRAAGDGRLPRARPGGCARRCTSSSRRRSTRGGSSRRRRADERSLARRERHPLPPGRARGQPDQRRRRRPRRSRRRSSGWSGRRTATRTASATLRHEDVDRRRALQRAGPLPARAAPRPASRGRHGRQVPGPAGAGRLLLDGELERARTSRAGSTSCSRATA